MAPIPSPQASTARLAGPVAWLLLPALALILLQDLSARPWAALSLLTLSFAGWAWALLRLPGGPVSAAGLLWVALLLRLAALPLQPTLSDDLWRYLWDGRVVAHGFNPYLLPPEASELEHLRDPVWDRVDHRSVPTVYPPLAVAAFGLVTALPAAPWSWKVLVAAADLVACWWLLGIARRRGALWRGAAYAWNPLVALEGAGMGHLDPLGVAFVVAAVAALLPRQRRAWGALAAAAGALVKLAPLAALPMWARQSRRPWGFLALAGGLAFAALLPVAVATGGVPPGLSRYALTWEHGGPLYEPLWRLMAMLRVDAAVHALLDLAKEVTGWHSFWNRFYPWLYPRSMTRAVLALAAAGVVWRSWSWRDPVAGSRVLFGTLLLCSPTLYPWYLLWVLPWAALSWSLPWLWASAAILLTYLPQHAGVPAWPGIHLAVWGPFLGLWLAQRRWRSGIEAPEPAREDPPERPP